MLRGRRSHHQGWPRRSDRMPGSRQAWGRSRFAAGRNHYDAAVAISRAIPASGITISAFAARSKARTGKTHRPAGNSDSGNMELPAPSRYDGCVGIHFLPFKGRARVGMGLKAIEPLPHPNLPPEGEGILVLLE